MSGPPRMVAREETRFVNRRLPLGAPLPLQRRERDEPTLSLQARAQAVEQDAEDPRADGRSPLEAPRAPDHTKPGILHAVLGESFVPCVHAREAEHRCSMPIHELDERDLLAPLKRSKQRIVVTTHWCFLRPRKRPRPEPLRLNVRHNVKLRCSGPASSARRAERSSSCNEPPAGKTVQ